MTETSLAALVRKLDEEGLTEAKHFALLVKDGGRSLFEVAFVDRTCSSDNVVAIVEGFLQTMAFQVAWTERLQTQGRDPRIADVLEALERGRRGTTRTGALRAVRQTEPGRRGLQGLLVRAGSARSCLLRLLGETGHRYCASVSTFLGVVCKVADVAEGETLAWKRGGRGRLCHREDD